MQLPNTLFGRRNRRLFFFFALALALGSSCDSKPGKAGTDTSCPVTETANYRVVISGEFGEKMREIKPPGEPATFRNVPEPTVKEMNASKANTVCSALERAGIKSGNDKSLPLLTVHLGGSDDGGAISLKSDRGSSEGRIPPAENAGELATNIDHTLARLAGNLP